MRSRERARAAKLALVSGNAACHFRRPVLLTCTRAVCWPPPYGPASAPAVRQSSSGSRSLRRFLSRPRAQRGLWIPYEPTSALPRQRSAAAVADVGQRRLWKDQRQRKKPIQRTGSPPCALLAGLACLSALDVVMLSLSGSRLPVEGISALRPPRPPTRQRHACMYMYLARRFCKATVPEYWWLVARAATVLCLSLPAPLHIVLLSAPHPCISPAAAPILPGTLCACYLSPLYCRSRAPLYSLDNWPPEQPCLSPKPASSTALYQPVALRANSHSSGCREHSKRSEHESHQLGNDSPWCQEPSITLMGCAAYVMTANGATRRGCGRSRALESQVRHSPSAGHLRTSLPAPTPSPVGDGCTWPFAWRSPPPASCTAWWATQGKRRRHHGIRSCIRFARRAPLSSSQVVGEPIQEAPSGVISNTSPPTRLSRQHVSDPFLRHSSSECYTSSFVN